METQEGPHATLCKELRETSAHSKPGSRGLGPQIPGHGHLLTPVGLDRLPRAPWGRGPPSHALILALGDLSRASASHVPLDSAELRGDSGCCFKSRNLWESGTQPSTWCSGEGLGLGRRPQRGSLGSKGLEEQSGCLCGKHGEVPSFQKLLS